MRSLLQVSPAAAMATQALRAAPLVLACSFVAAPALAQMEHVPETDWRRTDRHDTLTAAAKPPLFYFEVRFGAYWPSIDSDPKFANLPAEQRPYRSVFGAQCAVGATGCTTQSPNPLFYFGLEADVVPVRIPYVGAFGLGLGWGWTHNSATANFTFNAMNPGQPGGPSGETTSLTIMPMHASLVLRADELMRRTAIPIVPYAKVGVGLLYWHATTDSGTEVYDPCESITSTPAPAGCNKPKVDGQGLTPTLHFAVGGMIALNFIEPHASARLDEATGLHHAYVFGEYYNDQVPLRSDVMRVGTSSFAVGLAADF
jgi:hypothetical protein